MNDEEVRAAPRVRRAFFIFYLRSMVYLWSARVPRCLADPYLVLVLSQLPLGLEAGCCCCCAPPAMAPAWRALGRGAGGAREAARKN